MANSTQTIEALLEEERVFPPPEEFRRQAHVNTTEPYEKAARDREAFWGEAAEELDWFRRGTRS